MQDECSRPLLHPCPPGSTAALLCALTVRTSPPNVPRSGSQPRHVVTVLNVRVQTRVKLRHIGVDPLDLLVAGHADAVVAILDEVGVTELVQPHRLQLHAAMERSIHPLPLLRHAPPGGHEAAVELPVAIHAAHYLRDLDDPPAQIEAVVRSYRLPGLLKSEQPAPSLIPPNAGRQPSEECPVTGAQEVLLHLLLEAHVPDHQPCSYLFGDGFHDGGHRVKVGKFSKTLGQR